MPAYEPISKMEREPSKNLSLRLLQTILDSDVSFEVAGQALVMTDKFVREWNESRIALCKAQRNYAHEEDISGYIP